MTTHDLAPDGSSASLLPLMAAVFVVFLVTGAALPAIPLHIHLGLGYGADIVGLVSGAQFAAALLSRLWAGPFSDSRGPRQAVIVGIGMAVAAGVLYLLSLLAVGTPTLSVAILLVGRGLLGAAEGFIITGAQSWGLAISRPDAAGKVIGWIGTALYVALASGAPLGSLLFGLWGFAAIGVVTIIVPLVALAMVVPMRGVDPHPQVAGAWKTVLKAVWLPGVGISFASLGYGAMTAFGVLLFTQRGWEPAWLSFTVFALAVIAARLCIGWLPDRIGGWKAAVIFVTVQAVGMTLIWAAPVAIVGLVGAVLAGGGYALVYPALGMEAVRRAPPSSRGSAMGIYTAFIDVSLGILAPLLGVAAGYFGLGSVFLVGALLALATIPVALHLRQEKATHS